ncbi:PQQ-dependent sugar dehydrogenase [Novosphingobium sp.]|uniref:PQQ-dependent sugar dehydrogenase n=1 Tax=Novosphingobium sp. TaxID=1874826 RepID=UPI00262248AD|nr:PQQ-dependent sugar dehydrogenase [Novosphingobium sp.]
MIRRPGLATALALGAAMLSAQTSPPPSAPAGAPGPGGGFGGRELQRQTGQRFADNCGGCHGAPGTAGRAPNLFDQRLLSSRSDDELFRTISRGVEGAEMPAFGEILPSDQIWQLVAWLRLEADNKQPRPQFVADPNGAVIASERQRFRIEVVAQGLETPWGLAFLPDGRLLVTERPGRLRIVDRLINGAGRLLPDPVAGTPAVWARQDGGLMDVAVDPDFRRNGWIYLSLAELKPGYPIPPAPDPKPGERPPNHPSMTVILRGRINDRGEWADSQVLFRAPLDRYTPSGVHYGSRLAFDPQGRLLFTVGERGDMKNAQDLSTPLGKLHRINRDGSIPADNPFVNRPGAVPSILSWGHRNPQGLAFDAAGRLWEAEHGPSGGDEINLIQPGANYGWGIVSMGIQPGISAREAPGLVPPVAYYTPTIAPSGIALYRGTRYPGWNGNLLVAALSGQHLRRLVLDGTRITQQEVLFKAYGRVRAVTTGPDGLIYVLLQRPTGEGTGQPLSASTPGLVIRLVPLP